MFRSTLRATGRALRGNRNGVDGRILRQSRLIGYTGSFGGLLCWVGGCGIFAAAAAVAVVGLLSGIFFGAIQATFAATARSYAFEDRGPIQFVFSPPAQNNTALVNINGRLPGFHFVFVDIDDKGIVAAQGQEERLFETDAAISLDTNPPTITGTINEVGGGETFTIQELYPDRQISAGISEPDANGGRNVSFDFVGSGPEGDLSYSLFLQGARIEDGRLVGEVEVFRDFTTSSGRGVVIESNSGELIDVVENTGTLPSSNDELDNTNDEGDAGASEDGNADDEQTGGDETQDDTLDDSTADDEMPTDDQPTDDAPVDDMTDDMMDDMTDDMTDDGSGADDVPDEPQPISVSSCPGVIDQIVSLVDAQLQNGNFGVFDLNADGVITPSEVQQTIDPLFELIAGPLSNEAATCIADIANDAMR